MQRYIWSDAGHKVLDAKVIGERRLAELNLGYYKVRIDVAELGAYSIKNKPVIVALVGSLNEKVWRLVKYCRSNIEQYRGHAYIVRGRKVFAVEFKGLHGTVEHVMGTYEGMDRSTPLSYAKTEDIFRAGMGRSTKGRVSVKKGARYTKKGGLRGTTSRPTASGDVVCAAQPVIVTKRFPNSRLTCVCKSRAY